MYMWVEFVVGSCACFEGFSLRLCASGFPPSTKLTFQIPIQPASSGKEEPPSGMSIAEFPFIYLFILFNRDKKDGDQNLTKTNF